MPSIAVIDDRSEELESLVLRIGTVLPEEWSCIEAPLLSDERLYADWVSGHDVLVLLIDQILDDRAPPGSPAVGYKGHQIVGALRSYWPNFPIYMFSAHRSDLDLRSHEGEADGVYSRRDLREQLDMVVARMLRAAQRFYEERERQLQIMTELATKVATQTASEEEKEELQRIQISMGSLPAAVVSISREEALSAAENKADELQDLINEVQAALRKTK